MEVKNGRAQINIGKHGITQTFLDHLKNILKKEKIVKIKILKEISMEQGNETLINKILEELNVYILDSRGNTFIISKKKISGIHPPKKYLLLKNTLHPILKKKKQEKKEEETITNNDNISNNFSEPDYIDYDNEELVAEVDKQSDLLYGPISESFETEPEKKIKKPKAKINIKYKKNSKSKKQFKNKKKLKKSNKKRRNKHY